MKEVPQHIDVLIPEDQIKARIKELAQYIAEDYQDKPFIIVSILKGGVQFSAHLILELGRLNLDPHLSFLGKSSYGKETVSSGRIKTTLALDTDIEGQDVIILDDILDTGLTLKTTLEEDIFPKNPASVKVCVLLDKAEGRKVEVPVDYLGFSIPKKFVVGFGLDSGENYRSLPYIGVVSTS